MGAVDPSPESGAAGTEGTSNPPPPSVRSPSVDDDATVDTPGETSGPVAAKTADATSAPTASPAAAVATSGTRPFHRFGSFCWGAAGSAGFDAAGIGWV
ncbi:hypothetical protein A2J04_17515 [Rhodococcus sp. EPR-279]|nr:hypothetical protein A2J02_14795 [Rhodococcus sp. EPR-147]KZF12142.1 hypothetical protein A2J04_17515 [Rhodococcus sp. EPR-279]